MKPGLVIAALFSTFLSVFIVACSEVENQIQSEQPQLEQQAVADNFSEAEEVKVKEGCDYGNPPCEESYDCVSNKCVLKGGCNYNNPQCNRSYDCVNNSCVLKTGCNYNNPACDLNHSCTGNQCILKTGCKYKNPPCNSSQICQNNKCFELVFGSGY
ncbi:MAG: hypothetical protein AABX69_01230 [Nanoarchaeota archaeon]